MSPEKHKAIVELRHQLHRDPELSGSEVRTAERIRQFLREHTSLKIEDRDGWFYAVKEGTDPDAAMFYIGNGENWPALHTKEYDFNDNLLDVAAAMFLKLTDPG